MSLVEHPWPTVLDVSGNGLIRDFLVLVLNVLSPFLEMDSRGILSIGWQ